MVLQQRKSKGISVGARATVRRNANVFVSALTNVCAFPTVKALATSRPIHDPSQSLAI
jgi:hypothetical protein